ncbi:twin-arginine translocase TatA/TatE family subunit [uncultured Phascolarctobacterium sp.]|uniref:twin-arginine translocase TatA/TatE family subunit n=1 Tax=uncultured Phascolarctobacterium sp. TaxID=512296 RepID=UPI002622F622|nr:twin-arginine translocase TatA/TatE family subunit [uncultured Phascolarctobacterium sp.]
MRLGATELILILAIAFLVFGSSKLSGLGKALGTSIREFKEEVKGSETAETKESEQHDSEAAK